MAEFSLSFPCFLHGTQNSGYPREARGQAQPQSGHCRRPAPPPPGAHLHGNAGLRLFPPPGTCRPEAVRAGGFWENSLRAAFLRLLWTAKLLRIPSWRFAKEWGEGREGDAGLRGCGPFGRRKRRNLAGTFLGFPGGADRPLSPHPATGGLIEVDGKPNRAFSIMGESSISCVLRDPRLSPSPIGRFCSISRPGISRRVLGLVLGGGRRGRALRGGCRGL